MTKPDFAAHLIEGIEHFNSRRFWEAHEAWEMIWLEAPKWVTAIIYMSLGWFAIVAFPELWQELGIAGTLLVGAGGLLYTAGAVVYATQRPSYPDALPAAEDAAIPQIVIVAQRLHGAE